ncbi:MAG TPA: hypothetical protein P5514_12935 [Bacteroidales bacterium]|nr:hypothetical protein [Bacteroidales bacterium]
METVKIIKHQDISYNEKLEICKIKSVFGNYSVESQLKWMDKNLDSNDLHFLVYDNKKLIAYSNFINISIIINNDIIKAIGVGNVCSAEQAKGYGKLLMQQVNSFIKSKDIVGVLLCKESLIKFYENYSWIRIAKEKMKLHFTSEHVELMLYNYKTSIDSLEYSGDTF